MIEIGMTYTMEKTVTPDMTAKAVGSGGLEVFGTPFMMGLIGEGTHTRAVIDNTRFLQKCNDKLARVK